MSKERNAACQPRYSEFSSFRYQVPKAGIDNKLRGCSPEIRGGLITMLQHAHPAEGHPRGRAGFQRSAYFGLTLTAMFSTGMAATIAPAGCPMFHCTAEATGLVYQPLIQTVIASNSNNSLGSLLAQGCSGNGSTLSCLFSKDSATDNARGTLKLLNATTLQPIWGSAAAPNSYNLDVSAAYAQVPVNFADGSIAAGDASYHVLYDSSGSVIGKVSLGGKNMNFGLTPISATYGVVSQADGVLTLVNMTTWQNAGTLTLRDPQTKASIHLVSPSSGTSNTLYAVGQNTKNGNGFLFSVVLKQATHRLALRSTFAFKGASSATPVVVTPNVSGLPTNLILLHVPGLIGDPQPQDRLLGLSDSATTGLAQRWAIPLMGPLIVAATVDQGSNSLFYENGATIYQNSLITGDAINTFNLQLIGAFPAPFLLNGHVGASQIGSVFTLLLAGKYTASQGSGGAQYVMAFQPIASPAALLWATQIFKVQTGNADAWNFAPSSQPGVVCPIAIVHANGKSSIVRICDF
jgi:hypothetical protein